MCCHNSRLRRELIRCIALHAGDVVSWVHSIRHGDGFAAGTARRSRAAQAKSRIAFPRLALPLRSAFVTISIE